MFCENKLETLKEVKIKRIIAVTIATLLSPMSALGQSDYSLSWSLTGVADITRIELDIESGTRYFSANGGAIYTDGTVLPITGTCQFSSSNGNYDCNIYMAPGLSGYMVLDSNSNFSGKWATIDQTGSVIEEGTLTRQ